MLEDESMQWVDFSDSKYKQKLSLELIRKYKLLDEKGIRKLNNK